VRLSHSLTTASDRVNVSRRDFRPLRAEEYAMNVRALAVALVTAISFSLPGVMAAEEGDVVKVLVYEKGTKPSVAASNPKYEFRRIAAKKDPAYMCQHCLKAAFPDSGTKPSVAASRNEAFLCTSCQKLVFCESGHEVALDEKHDMAACDKMIAELKKGPTPDERAQAYKTPAGTTKPSVDDAK
jgi:hypothetical protein